MRIVITGGNGFIARTLQLRLRESGYSEIVSLTRDNTADDWKTALGRADTVFHLAGVNRTTDHKEFEAVNVSLTERVCDTLSDSQRCVPLVLSSSTQAESDNEYGRSKRKSEEVVEQYANDAGARGCVLRFPNVFGKWARPNYNSAIATFCHNIARGLPITVNDPDAPLTLMHVDDAVSLMVSLLPPSNASGRIPIEPVYRTTVGIVAEMLQDYGKYRSSGKIGSVGKGLQRALYSTFVSYLPATEFAYEIKQNVDDRGAFSEVLRNADCGQVSYFTAHPGVTRGEHYHHTKTEKFVVVQGQALFTFRQLITNEMHSINVSGDKPQVVDTAPGWVHSITNVGTNELVVLLWANELFDPQRPDTFASKVSQ